MFRITSVWHLVFLHKEKRHYAGPMKREKRSTLTACEPCRWSLPLLKLKQKCLSVSRKFRVPTALELPPWLLPCCQGPSSPKSLQFRKMPLLVLSGARPGALLRALNSYVRKTTCRDALQGACAHCMASWHGLLRTYEFGGPLVEIGDSGA